MGQTDRKTLDQCIMLATVEVAHSIVIQTLLTRNLRSCIDVHAHVGSVFYNHVTLTYRPYFLRPLSHFEMIIY